MLDKLGSRLILDMHMHLHMQTPDQPSFTCEGSNLELFSRVWTSEHAEELQDLAVSFIM